MDKVFSKVAEVAVDLNFEKTVARLRAAAVELCNAEHAIVYLADTDARELLVYAGALPAAAVGAASPRGGAVQPDAPAKPMRAPITAGFAGYVACTGKTVSTRLDDRTALSKRFDAAVDCASGAPDKPVDAHSLMMLPMLSDLHELMGLVCVLNSKGASGAFNEEDELLLRLLCRQGGYALKNCSAHAALRESRSKSGQLLKVAKLLAEDNDMDTTVRLAATAARDLLGAEAGSFALVDKETRSAVLTTVRGGASAGADATTAGGAEPAKDRPKDKDRPATGAAAVVQCEHDVAWTAPVQYAVEEHDVARSAPGGALRKNGNGSVVAAPVFGVDGGVFAVLQAHGKCAGAHKEFTREDEALLTSLTGILSASLKNLHFRSASLSLQRKIAVVASGESLEDTVDLVELKAKDCVECRYSKLDLVSNTAERRSLWRFDSAARGQLTRVKVSVPLHCYPAGHVVSTAHVLAVADTSKDSRVDTEELLAAYGQVVAAVFGRDRRVLFSASDLLRMALRRAYATFSPSRSWTPAAKSSAPSR